MNVYDFDNTIYDGESFIDLFIFLFKKDPSLVKYIPDVINGLYKYTKGTINAEEALEQYSDVVTDYYNNLREPRGSARRCHAQAQHQELYLLAH